MMKLIFDFTPLRLSERAPDGTYVVLEPCTVRLNGSFLTVIEAGFRTDKTSWPWWLCLFVWLPPVGRWLDQNETRYDQAAALHDHLLDTTDWPKWMIDWLYLGALRSTGVSALEAFIFGAAVRTRR